MSTTMCLMQGCPQSPSDRAERGCPRTPTVAAAAPRATVDSHSRRPVVFAMVNVSGGHEARGSQGYGASLDDRGRDAVAFQCVETGAAPPGAAPVAARARFLLDQCPDPAVALVIGICALGKIAFAHLREVVRGVGEFEQRLEACEIRGKLTLPVLRYCAELVRERGGDLVQARGVQADDLPLVGVLDLRVAPLLLQLLGNLEPPERLVL